MMRLAWKSIYLFGFIIFLLFSGCRDQERSISEKVDQANALMEVGQMEGAINLLESCLELDSNRVDALELLAFAYSANGDPVLAAITFKRIAELVPEQSEYLLYAAESLVEAGDRKGAVDLYEEYLAVRPEDRPVWIILAGLQQEAGRISEAIEAYLAAERIEAVASQELAVGQLYLQTQNLAQAQVWFARALQGDMELRDEALLGLLETAVRAKRFQEADALLEQIDAEYPGLVDQSPINNLRDQLLAWERRREAAKAALAELEKKPELNLPEEQIPAIEQVPEAPEEEIPAVEPELAMNEEEPAPVPETTPQPPVPAMEDPLADARKLREDGQLDEAIRAYKQLLIENDNQPWAWAELSEAYLEAGNDRWAQATASEAVRRDPDNPRFVLQFLRAAQRTMKPERLLKEMESAYRQFPNQPEVVLVLARAFAGMDNTRNARLLYERFLGLVPENHPVRAEVELELERLGG